MASMYDLKLANMSIIKAIMLAALSCIGGVLVLGIPQLGVFVKLGIQRPSLSSQCTLGPNRVVRLREKLLPFGPKMCDRYLDGHVRSNSLFYL